MLVIKLKSTAEERRWGEWTWCAYGCQYTCNTIVECLSISVPTSAGRTANAASPGCTGRSVNRQCRWRLLRSFPLRQVCGISIFEYSILTHYASHTAKHSTGIQKQTRCSGSRLLPSTSLIRPHQNIVSNTFISLL